MANAVAKRQSFLQSLIHSSKHCMKFRRGSPRMKHKRTHALPSDCLLVRKKSLHRQGQKSFTIIHANSNVVLNGTRFPLRRFSVFFYLLSDFAVLRNQVIASCTILCNLYTQGRHSQQLSSFASHFQLLVHFPIPTFFI